jgi:branched-chain amino acid transport system ATP-binding protein
MTMVEARSTADRLGSVSSGNALELRGVTKMFGALAAIRDVTLTVGSGETSGGARARTGRARPPFSTA